jgi:ABC-type Fe3+/spermidine/putrescine transport system ATPase subunit
MANRIAVMESGKVRQIAAPADLYEFPNCKFVADFIGKMNLFEGKVVGVSGDQIVLEAKGIGRITVPYSGSAQGSVGIAVRPEKMRLDHGQPPSDRVSLRGRVTELAYYGDESNVFLENETGVTVNVNVPNEARTTNSAFAIGDELWLSWNPADTLVLTE